MGVAGKGGVGEEHIPDGGGVRKRGRGRGEHSYTHGRGQFALRRRRSPRDKARAAPWTRSDKDKGRGWAVAGPSTEPQPLATFRGGVHGLGGSGICGQVWGAVWRIRGCGRASRGSGLEGEGGGAADAASDSDASRDDACPDAEFVSVCPCGRTLR